MTSYKKVAKWLGLACLGLALSSFHYTPPRHAHSSFCKRYEQFYFLKGDFPGIGENKETLLHHIALHYLLFFLGILHTLVWSLEKSLHILKRENNTQDNVEEFISQRVKSKEDFYLGLKHVSLYFFLKSF